MRLLKRHSGLQRQLDRRAGVLAALIVNVNRAKDSQPAKPGDFFPSLADDDKPRVARTTEEQIEAMHAWAAAINGSPVDLGE